MSVKQHISYSEAFKRQVVEQIETGKFRCADHARRAYGVRGTGTIGRWLRKYGSGQHTPKRIKIMNLDEVDETKELKKRVRALESALADAQMRYLLSESHLEIACKRMDTDADTFKKKHATNLFGRPGGKAQP